MRVWVRAVFVVALLGVLATAAMAEDGFTDVPPDHVFAEEIAWLASGGITRGCNPPDNTRFCPDDNVTRGQMAAFLVRALGLSASGPGFDDTAGHVFEEDISQLAEAGITRGCNPPDNTRFCPDDPVTRGQMAAFLHRALQVEPFLSTSVSTGGVHSCAVATDATVWCWGRNDDLQLGDASVDESSVPLQVSSTRPFAQVTVGGSHSCVLDTDGVAWCWGLNANGQLGAAGPSSADPVAVSGGHVFETIVSGRNHTCGLDAAGTAWCWGFNGNGQLGDGEVEGSPQPVEVAGGHTFTSITAGDEHACALDAGQTAWCWGWNGRGQLGDDTTVDSQTPVAVPDLTFSSIAAGGDHTCAVAADGDTWCWGRNDRGQVGDNSRGADRSAPVAVAGDHAFTALEAGDAHTCGITEGGAAWCWGADPEGRLGDGAAGDDGPVPRPVLGDQSITAISAGGRHTCAVDDESVTRCWGWNGNGQLGDGTNEDRSRPAVVRAGSR